MRNLYEGNEMAGEKNGVKCLSGPLLEIMAGVGWFRRRGRFYVCSVSEGCSCVFTLYVVAVEKRAYP